MLHSAALELLEELLREDWLSLERDEFEGELWRPTPAR